MEEDVRPGRLAPKLVIPHRGEGVGKSDILARVEPVAFRFVLFCDKFSVIQIADRRDEFRVVAWLD